MEGHLRSRAILNITKASNRIDFLELTNPRSYLGYPTVCLELSLRVAGVILWGRGLLARLGWKIGP